jgi:transposase
MKRYERRTYHLEPEALAALEHAFKYDKRRGVKLRSQALVALHRGHSVDETAALCGVTTKTVYTWHTAYTEQGIDGLVARKPGGKQPKATPEYVALLEEALASAPLCYGYDFTLWTAERLCSHLLQQTGIELRPRTLYELLERQGYVYRRPKQSLTHLQDTQALEQARANWELLKRGRTVRPTPTALTNWSPWMKQP